MFTVGLSLCVFLGGVLLGYMIARRSLSYPQKRSEQWAKRSGLQSDIRPYVVRVWLEGEHRRVGQGVAWDTHRILTNRHVIEGASQSSEVFVLLNGGWCSANRVVWSTSHDVAMIEFSEPHGIPVANMRGVPPIGEAVFYYNVAEGRAVSGVALNDANSLVNLEAGRYLASSLPARSGDSGGPVFDVSGNIIGMLTCVAETAKGASPKAYHLHSQLLRDVMVVLTTYDGTD